MILQRLLLIFILVASAGSLQAFDIVVLGLFKDMAIIRVDNHQYKLRVGEATEQGIRLISADSKRAVLDVDGQRETFELGSHVSSSFAAPKTAKARIRSINGMYTIQGFINRQPVNFLVDTGASWIALNANQAQKLGINFRYEGTPGVVSTANGQARVYRLKLKTVRVGEIELRNVDAAVLEGDSPTTALLGMSFLNRVRMKHEGDVLMLQQK